MLIGMTGLILPYKGITPIIDETAFIAQNAAVTGDTHIGADSSVWFSVSIRGDVHSVRIGARTNIQDNAVVHVTGEFSGTVIGDEVTIGHSAIIHACTIKDQCLVGMGAIVLDGAVMEPQSMLAAGAMLTPGKTIPSGELWAGSPAKFMRKLSQEELDFFAVSAQNYVDVSRAYL